MKSAACSLSSLSSSLKSRLTSIGLVSRPLAVKLAANAALSVAALCSAALVAPAAFAQEAAPKAPVAAAAAPDLAKGQAIATQVCAACHSYDGSRGSPANPILQGQHPEYLVKQLTEFKAGVRPSPIMKAMASALSEADMKNVAAFYATKSAKPGFSKDKEMVALGEKIFRGGISEKALPACAGCHSPDGAGLPIKFPRIGGQHADYTEAQMVNFRSGVRANGPMMVAIAAKMSDREIKAVSDYIAGLQRPGN